MFTGIHPKVWLMKTRYLHVVEGFAGKQAIAEGGVRRVLDTGEDEGTTTQGSQTR